MPGREDFEAMGLPSKSVTVRRDHHQIDTQIAEWKKAVATRINSPGDAANAIGIVGAIDSNPDRLVTIIIPTKEDAESLIRCLIAVRNHVWPTP